jgi:hypothetical protein
MDRIADHVRGAPTPNADEFFLTSLRIKPSSLNRSVNKLFPTLIDPNIEIGDCQAMVHSAWPETIIVCLAVFISSARISISQ